MIGISAQVSLYPLGPVDMAPAVADFLSVLDAQGLERRTGDMSTVVWGDAADVFAALQEAFERVAETRAAVMVVTVSNACPVSGMSGALSLEA